MSIYLLLLSIIIIYFIYSARGMPRTSKRFKHRKKQRNHAQKVTMNRNGLGILLLGFYLLPYVMWLVIIIYTCTFYSHDKCMLYALFLSFSNFLFRDNLVHRIKVENWMFSTLVRYFSNHGVN